MCSVTSVSKNFFVKISFGFLGHLYIFDSFELLFLLVKVLLFIKQVRMNAQYDFKLCLSAKMIILFIILKFIFSCYFSY